MLRYLHSSSLARRSFLSRLGIGPTGGAALGAAAVSPVQAQTGSGRFQPARHAADDWLDQMPGQHRFVFDAISPDGISLAMTFINNYMNANDAGYGRNSRPVCSSTPASFLRVSLP